MFRPAGIALYGIVLSATGASFAQQLPDRVRNAGFFDGVRAIRLRRADLVPSEDLDARGQVYASIEAALAEFDRSILWVPPPRFGTQVVVFHAPPMLFTKEIAARLVKMKFEVDPLLVTGLRLGGDSYATSRNLMESGSVAWGFVDEGRSLGIVFHDDFANVGNLLRIANCAKAQAEIAWDPVVLEITSGSVGETGQTVREALAKVRGVRVTDVDASRSRVTIEIQLQRLEQIRIRRGARSFESGVGAPIGGVLEALAKAGIEAKEAAAD
jgi:hypothetical protein